MVNGIISSLRNTSTPRTHTLTRERTLHVCLVSALSPAVFSACLHGTGIQTSPLSFTIVRPVEFFSFLERNATGPQMDRGEETSSLLRLFLWEIQKVTDASTHHLTVMQSQITAWVSLAFMEGLVAERAKSEFHIFLAATPQLALPRFSVQGNPGPVSETGCLDHSHS